MGEFIGENTFVNEFGVMISGGKVDIVGGSMEPPGDDKNPSHRDHGLSMSLMRLLGDHWVPEVPKCPAGQDWL